MRDRFVVVCNDTFFLVTQVLHGDLLNDRDRVVARTCANLHVDCRDAVS